MIHDILNFLETEANAKLARATLTLNLLSEHPAGIGDHSTEDFYNNIRSSFAHYMDALDELEVLRTVSDRGSW
jgi:hypothetical protein